MVVAITKIQLNVYSSLCNNKSTEDVNLLL